MGELLLGRMPRQKLGLPLLDSLVPKSPPEDNSEHDEDETEAGGGFQQAGVRTTCKFALDRAASLGTTRAFTPSRSVPVGRLGR